MTKLPYLLGAVLHRPASSNDIYLFMEYLLRLAPLLLRSLVRWRRGLLAVLFFFPVFILSFLYSILSRCVAAMQQVLFLSPNHGVCRRSRRGARRSRHT